MNKKTTYWTIGILAAILLIAVIWLFSSSRRSVVPNEGNTAQNELANNTNQADLPNEEQPATDGRKDDDIHAGHNAGNETQNSDTQAATTDQNFASYIKEQDEIMNKMMTDMENIEESGYAATDFLSGMIPHHEAAVAMAESYLKYGAQNEQLKVLAQAIIDAQNKEIDQMNSLIQEYQTAQKQDTNKADAHMKEYREMFEDHHNMHGTTSDNVDAAFAEGMLMHHEMAVDMAEDILEYTDEEDVRTLAQNIIDTQKQEIDEMEDILDNLKQE